MISEQQIADRFNEIGASWHMFETLKIDRENPCDLFSHKEYVLISQSKPEGHRHFCLVHPSAQFLKGIFDL